MLIVTLNLILIHLTFQDSERNIYLTTYTVNQIDEALDKLRQKFSQSDESIIMLTGVGSSKLQDVISKTLKMRLVMKMEKLYLNAHACMFVLY